MIAMRVIGEGLLITVLSAWCMTGCKSALLSINR